MSSHERVEIRSGLHRTVQKPVVLRVTCAYHTASESAVMVIVEVIPLLLLLRKIRPSICMRKGEKLVSLSETHTASKRAINLHKIENMDILLTVVRFLRILVVSCSIL